eukprot:TRINITY_DN14251_c0_g1_i1.p1 TRINITY_DN14251_c0_g1~~TRINITY_DN14251_c0_g1_i1.p1  ORF type:complete len:473 (-),score=81.59 TRINITY_DN14251_c0_g1_i1:119-1459(-)
MAHKVGGVHLAGGVAAAAAAVANGLGQTALLFSGFVNPCRYLQLHKGFLGLNFFKEYPGCETSEDLEQVIRRYCFKGKKLTNIGAASGSSATLEEPFWRSGYEERRFKHRQGTVDCFAGLRAPPNFGLQGKADIMLEDFGFMAEQLAKKGIMLNGYFVNLGAADGVWSDPLTEYARLHRARGLAVEAIRSRCASYRRNFPGVSVLCLKLTPSTLPQVAAQAPREYDILKLDLDSYDCQILSALVNLFGHRPTCILLEINPSFPPPFDFAMEHHVAWDELNSTTAVDPDANKNVAYGCSLTHVVKLLANIQPGYVLFQMFRKDVAFLRVDIAERVLGTQEAPDEFECFQGSLLETRGVAPERLRRWFYDTDLQNIESEMRGMLHEHLTDRFGETLGRRIPYRLAVTEPSRGRLAGAREGRATDSALVDFEDPGTGNMYVGFRDLVET